MVSKKTTTIKIREASWWEYNKKNIPFNLVLEAGLRSFVKNEDSIPNLSMTLVNALDFSGCKTW